MSKEYILKNIFSDVFNSRVKVSLRIHTSSSSRKKFLIEMKNESLIKRLKRKYARTQ